MEQTGNLNGKKIYLKTFFNSLTLAIWIICENIKNACLKTINYCTEQRVKSYSWRIFFLFKKIWQPNFCSAMNGGNLPKFDFLTSNVIFVIKSSLNLRFMAVLWTGLWARKTSSCTYYTRVIRALNIILFVNYDRLSVIWFNTVLMQWQSWLTIKAMWNTCWGPPKISEIFWTFVDRPALICTTSDLPIC